MDAGALLALATVLVGWAVLSEWLAARNLTAPLVLVAAGVLLTVVGLAISLWYLLRIRPDLAAIERGELKPGRGRGVPG